jgi:hypothetical protein
MTRASMASLAFCLFAAIASAQNSTPETPHKTPSTSDQKAVDLKTVDLKSIAEKTASMQKLPGFFTCYWDAREGKLWLQVDKWNVPFLFYETLPNGVGSNDVGLDRGQPGKIDVVHFERSGPRILLVAENESYRAVTDDLEQQSAVRQAFAQSVLWGFEAVAQNENGDGDGQGQSVLVDATPFFLSDTHEVAARLAATQQGAYHVDPSRSAIYLPRTRNFPENTDIESTLTLVGENPGHWVEDVTPNPRAITVHEHFSFIQAPADGFRERSYDPRSSFFGISYMDFATPIDQPIVKRYIAHYRLSKKDPAAASGEPVKPIVYYVDRAIPEPIRSAVLEGASWWNTAFTAAGYKEAFQVKLLPEGVDPMDIRYNVIEWVPRATRGWAYGTAISDPRTGEIINGHVNLDALRIRQVFLIAQGLLDPFGKDPTARKRANEMALARLRQLAAHETGHTLGLMHNYTASIVNRSSVMDYPPPTVTLGADGRPDVSDAYAVGIGEWDKVSIAYGYSDLSRETNETQALDKILDDAFGRGLLYLTDQDARPLGSASPVAHLWDTGSNALDGLTRVMAVRAAALKNLSESAIPEHTPMATLEDVLVPMYLYHRYQVSAVAKSIGGLDYAFNLRGNEGNKDNKDNAPKIVPAAQQRASLHAVLATLSPEVLAVPEPLVKMIPPRPPEYPTGRENFSRRTSPAFDALAPAEAAAEIVANLLLQPERAQRMIEYHALDAGNPGFDELVTDLLAATWKAQPTSGDRGGDRRGYKAAIQRTVNWVVLDRLMMLAADDHASAQVRGVAALKLDELRKWIAMQTPSAKDEAARAQLFFAESQIGRFQKNPAEVHLTAPAPPPDGDPIGTDGWE